MKIALLDNNPVDLNFLYVALSSAGYRCITFTSGVKLMRTLGRQTFDLIVMERQIPDLSGDVLLAKIRCGSTFGLPVLFVTHRSSEIDVVGMLQAGADNYLVKPVDPTILVAHVAALFRRVYQGTAETDSTRFGSYEFRNSSREIVVADMCVQLSRKQYELALLLFRNLGRPLSRDYVIERIWPESVDGGCSLDTYISYLREKLNLRGGVSYVLSTIYGFGYRLDKISFDKERIDDSGVDTLTECSHST